MKSLIPAITILFLTFSSLPIVGQDTDMRAKKILEDVSEKYRSYNTLKADFKFTLESRADDFSEVQSGTIYLKNDNFKLVLGDQQIICDNRYIWTFLEDVNEVQINNYDPAEIEMNPSEMFTMYESGFLYAYMGETIIGGRVYDVIELTPEDKDKPFFKVRLKIDQRTKHMVHSKIFQRNGTIYSYEITKHSPNISLCDDFFKFKTSDHPGITVVDLR